jgi:hypothetical protein
VSRPTDGEISRALNALSTTLRDQRPAELDERRAQAIVDGALAGARTMAVRRSGPTAGELRVIDGDALVAAIELREGRWQVDRRLRAGVVGGSPGSGSA